MLSLRTIYMTVAVLGMVGSSLAAPSMDGDSVAQMEQRQDVPEEFVNRAEAAAGCYVTSKRGKNCHASQCPAREQCKVNARGNCVWKNKKKDRPFGCGQCSCKKYT